MLVILDKENEQDVTAEALIKYWQQKGGLNKKQSDILCSLLRVAANPDETHIEKHDVHYIRALTTFSIPKYEIPIYCEMEKLTTDDGQLNLEIPDEIISIFVDQLYQLYWMDNVVEEKLDNAEGAERYSLGTCFDEATTLWEETIAKCRKLLARSKMDKTELLNSAFPDDDLQMDTTTENVVSTPATTYLMDSTTGFPSMVHDQTLIINKNELRYLNWEMVLRLKMGIYLTNSIFDAYVENRNAPGKMNRFGFASHQNQLSNMAYVEMEKSELLVTRCPQKCTLDDRQWICVICGHFFKVQNFEVICKCGTTHVANLKFECFHHEHPKTFSAWSPIVLSTIPSTSSSPEPW
uniref:Uncharacterized protein n=1 Tax=Panagrolaimus sp. JU765 TaxID=591449 RepID=A0AC34RPN1_9BILA